MKVNSSSSFSELPSADRGCKPTILAEDIWLEIFVFLPLNSIFKFKCVSEVWYSLLSSPYFINKWIKHNSSNKSVPWALLYSRNFTDCDPWRTSSSIASLGVHSQFISKHNGLSFKFLAPRLHERDKQLYVLGSSKGLVLLAPTFYNQATYFVCNPLTRKWVSLPLAPQPDESFVTVPAFICECFPSTSYNVVRIPKRRTNTSKFSIDIFSSDKNQWTTCQVLCPEDVTWRLPLCNGVVSHNGNLYWIGNQNRILVYNLNKNKCWLIDLPAEEVVNVYSLRSQCLNVSEGLICYARVENTELSFRLSVWVLKENWQLLHKDMLSNEVRSELFGTKSFWLSPALSFDTLDKNIVMLGGKDYLWAYNIQTRKVDFFCESHSSFRCETNAIFGTFQPIVLKLWPTILPVPAPSW